MTREEILSSQVQLSAIVVARDVQNTPQHISCVGEAARFMLANYPPERCYDADWKLATKSLWLAALTNNIEVCIQATSAFIALLEKEGLFVAAE
jgi:isoaspartyl peptidase/L-asparaginase-like protein (Ntn-hydrolase superfamily)